MAQNSAQDDVARTRLGRAEQEFGRLQANMQMAQGYGSQSYGSQGYGSQGYGSRPPATVGDGEDYAGGRGGDDAAGLEVRITRLEEQIRRMTGDIEQVQFAQRKLEDQLKKFQQDVDFRFQDAGSRGGAVHPGKRTELPDGELGAPAASTASALGARPSASQTTPLSTGRRGDAFDPDLDPTAPGAPRQLGSVASTATALPPPVQTKTASASTVSASIADDQADPNAPLDLTSRRTIQANASANSPANSSASASPNFGTANAPRQIPLTPSSRDSETPGTQVASIPQAASPKEEFDSALGSFKQKEYETAERSFSAFLQKNPKNKMAPDAIYYLGESYFQRGRQREAAEQYLKISTDYASSPHAPEAMLRLGQSLKALGAKEQACATFSEVTRKYPNAMAWVKTGAEREVKHLQC